MTAQTILPANTLSSGYDVANSLRFNDGSSDFLSRSISSTGNRRKWTFSAWVKRSSMGTGSIRLMSVRNGNEQEWIGFDENDIHISRYNNSYVYRYITNRKFRDPSAFYHVCVAMDSEQSTAGNRMKLYVNGVQETSFSTETQISEDYNTSWNTASFTNYIGNNGNSGDYYDGYMSEVVLIDGQQLDPTSFGEFDEDSPTIWKPKDVSGLTFGTNGFYLDFENSGSLGADVSGNGNNFTVNNLTSIDQSTDTCTNNFCTLNPNIVFGANNSAFSEGNLVYDDSRGDWRAAIGTFGASSGKWYYEIKLGGGTYHQVGIVGTTVPTSSANLIDLSQVHGGFSFYNDNGNLIARTDGNTISGWASGNVNTTAQTDDILQVALDMDNKYIYFGKAGTFVKSGDPTSGSNGTGGIDISSDYTAGVVAIPGITMYNSADGSINFGSPAFAISSGNADANGHGNFEYAVPSGYFALCTKNLAEHG